ncbi:RNase A-like domain-containing protein [Roseiarcus fermentans]|uniref:RNase A-like domain-containing protein n=1 Tax=Roseiarcus fermentans TaxID=1473586 RepID=UPI001472CC2E|nr:RNase A-like domain-containing protein [Roseiarcus fermentans]
MRDHVGKSPAELISQVESTRVDLPFPGPFGVLSRYVPEGTYSSWESANDFVNRLLQSNTDTVDAVASGRFDKAWIEQRIGYPTGQEAFFNGEIISTRDTYNAGVLIVHDARVPRGYRVKTAYPRNDKRSYPSSVIPQ